MKFYTTGQIQGKYIIDTSPNGGVFFLKPDFEMHDLYQKGEIGHKDYIKNYLYRMRRSYETSRDMWDWLLKNNSTIIFGCDYRQTEEGESHLPELSRILQRLGAEYLGHLTGSKLKLKGWIDNDQII
jgi:hypothetical protein